MRWTEELNVATDEGCGAGSAARSTVAAAAEDASAITLVDHEDHHRPAPHS